MDKHEKLVNSSYLGLALFIYSNLHSPSSIIESIVCCVIFYSINNNCVPVHMTLLHHTVQNGIVSFDILPRTFFTFPHSFIIGTI